MATIDQIADTQTDIIDLLDGGALGRQQAGFVALAEDLRGVVRTMMRFQATLDASIANPTNVDRGTFNSLATLVSTAPHGAYIIIELPPGVSDLEDLLPDGNATSVNQLIRFVSADPDNRATLRCSVVVAGGGNRYRRLNVRGGIVHFYGVDIILDGRVNDGLPWSPTFRAPIRSTFDVNGDLGVWLIDCSVSGSDDAALVTLRGSNVRMSLDNVELTGKMSLIAPVAGGTLILGRRGPVTTSGGATITNGGLTLGTNYLEG